MRRGASRVPTGALPEWHSSKSARPVPGASVPHAAHAVAQAGLSTAPGLERLHRGHPGASAGRWWLTPLRRCGRRWGAGGDGVREGERSWLPSAKGKPRQPAASPPRFPEKNPIRIPSRPSTKAPTVTAHQAGRARCGHRASPGAFLRAPFATGTELRGQQDRGLCKERETEARRTDTWQSSLSELWSGLLPRRCPRWAMQTGSGALALISGWNMLHSIKYRRKWSKVGEGEGAAQESLPGPCPAASRGSWRARTGGSSSSLWGEGLGPTELLELVRGCKCDSPLVQLCRRGGPALPSGGSSQERGEGAGQIRLPRIVGAPIDGAGSASPLRGQDSRSFAHPGNPTFPPWHMFSCASAG